MAVAERSLCTRRGTIRFPAYLPVTTFGKKYPLDALIRPYLPRLAQAAMVSFYYARQIAGDAPSFPLFVDSGGFVSLFERARVVEVGRLGAVEVAGPDGLETIHPADVLDLQEKVAEVAFTLDFPSHPGMDEREACLRQELTIKNAHWALANRRRRDLPLFAVVQAWDVPSAQACVRAYAGAAFDGLALGGLVPRARDIPTVLSLVEAVRAERADLPLHVFGLGQPDLVARLFQAGVDSVDSSAYVKLAAEGRLWGSPGCLVEQPSVSDRLHLALLNLAMATQQPLPLSVSRLVFNTQALVASAAGLSSGSGMAPGTGTPSNAQLP